jgi:hypothetical protein
VRRHRGRGVAALHHIVFPACVRVFRAAREIGETPQHAEYQADQKWLESDLKVLYSRWVLGQFEFRSWVNYDRSISSPLDILFGLCACVLACVRKWTQWSGADFFFEFSSGKAGRNLSTTEFRQDSQSLGICLHQRRLRCAFTVSLSIKGNDPWSHLPTIRDKFTNSHWPLLTLVMPRVTFPAPPADWMAGFKPNKDSQPITPREIDYEQIAAKVLSEMVKRRDTSEPKPDAVKPKDPLLMTRSVIFSCLTLKDAKAL